MAQIPAEPEGSFDLLLERLRSGEAGPSDQKWAARILEAARIPRKIAGGQAKAQSREFRIYLMVRDEIERLNGDKEGAFQNVAKQLRTARAYDDGDGDDGKRELSVKRVRNIFLERSREHARLARWWEENRHQIEGD